MSATDELRRLLDERGVKCRQTEWIDGITIKWHGSDGIEYGARNGLSFDGPTGGVVLYHLTPEQAVDATLGRGACKVVSSMDMTDDYEYDATSYWFFKMTCGGVFYWMKPEPPSFCPCCGAKVVDV